MERLLLIAIIVALLIIGWNRPLREEYERLINGPAPEEEVAPGSARPAGVPASQPSTLQSLYQRVTSTPTPTPTFTPKPTPKPTPKLDRRWMFEPGKMDRPHK